MVPDLSDFIKSYGKPVSFTLFCLLHYLFAESQQFPIQKLTVEEGLGHSIVYRTLQSSDGYLWFSTDNGLTRFDGVNLKNFTSEHGLFSNFIFDIIEWKGKLYVCTFGGGVMTFDSQTFRPLTDSLEHVPLYPLELQVYNDNLWIIDRFKRLYRFDGKEYTEIKNEELRFYSDLVIDYYKFEVLDSVLYVASNRGLYAINKSNTGEKQDLPTSTPLVFNVTKLKNNHLLVINWDQLIEYDPVTGKSLVLLKDQKFSRNSLLMEDSEQNLWVGTIGGDLYFISKDESGGAKSMKILDGLVLNDIYEDKERNIWLSTYGEGAWCIQSIHIRNYPIKGCIVSDIILDKANHNFVITTINSGMKFFHQEKSNLVTTSIDESLNKFSLNKSHIISGLALPGGAIVFSSEFMLYKWNKGKTHSLLTERLISSLYFQKSRNRLWIGGRFSLSYTDSLLHSLTPVPGFDGKVVRCITENAEGKILVGTDAGIFIEKDDAFVPISTEGKVPTTYFNALYRDKKTDQIWAGTNVGLGKIVDGRFELINHPLTKVRCNSITGDDSGNIWVGTVNGLIYTDGSHYEMLTVKEGIAQSNIIRVNYDDKSAILALLSPNALSMIDVKKFFPFSKFGLPEVLIEEAKSGGRKLNLAANSILLKEGVRQIDLLISTPKIKNRDKIQYSYRINDKPWTQFNGREISLHSLPYGPLTINIKANKFNEDGNEKVKSLSVFVVRPFYLRWWFILIMSLVGIASILLLVWLYSRNRSRKLEEENKRLDVEHKALRNLLNPHFLYNAINSIHAFILQNDQRKTLGYLAKFSQLVRLNLELLSKDNVTLEKEIKNISLYLEFEKLRFAEKLQYSIDIDPSIQQGEIRIPSFIIQPFLENAIWHGLLPREEGGHLALKVNLDSGKLNILIEDDGIGINTSLKSPKPDIEKKDSMGIAIIRERIELLRKLNSGYRLMIIDKAELNGKATNTGTVVKITVPLDL